MKQKEVNLPEVRANKESNPASLLFLRRRRRRRKREDERGRVGGDTGREQG